MLTTANPDPAQPEPVDAARMAGGSETVGADRFRRLDGLFNAALDLPTAERPAFLARECADDAELRSEVEGMLAVVEGGDADHRLAGVVAGGFLLEEEPESSTGASPEPDTLRFGPYRILDELGRGGLGTVYLAERDDAEFSRRVALKLVRRGMESEEIRERLRLERQILAKLDHPNIARLYDGGTTDDGMPYFVMEVIDGDRLDHWCTGRKATLEQRLELMQKICDAVHYAHRNLVLHRDLKPSNILVNSQGEPKLLDFGIAKVLDSEVDDPASTLAVGSTDLTRTGHLLLTPEFASPEQVRAEPLTTASDVYALGVVLYHLVTGQRPYEFDRRRASEIERVVCTVDPERASAAARRRPESAAPGWSPGGGDDLDNIIAKALRKEPERRYGSAAELAEDLRRYRADLPVQARPDTLRYRTSKFVRRHRVTVVAAALVFVALVTAVLVTSQQARVARAERAESEEVVEFLLGVFELSDPNEALGETITAREILDRSVDRIRRDPLRSPEHRATFLATMGRVYRNLALYEAADSLLGEAVGLWREMGGEHDEERALALIDRARLELARSNFVSARSMIAEALEVRPAAWRSGQARVVEALSLDAQAATGLELHDEAEALFDRALSESERGGDPVLRATVLDGLGEMWLQRDEIARAEALFRTSLDLRLRHLGDLHPDAAHPDIAESWNELGRIFLSRGHADKAEPYLRQALGAYSQLFGPEHDFVATLHLNLGTSLLFQERPIEALELYQRSLELRREVHGADHPKVAQVHDSLARNHQMLASQASRRGDGEGRSRHRQLAKEHAQRAWDTKRKVLSAEDSGVLRSRGVLADLLRGEDVRAAHGHYVAIVDAHRRKDPTSIALAQALVDLGRALHELNEPTKAEEGFREAIAIYQQRGVEGGSWYLGQAQGHLGILLAEQGRSQEALSLVISALGSYGERYADSPLSRRLSDLRTELEVSS